MNLKPLHDRVIIKVEETESTTESGLILTQTSQDKSNRGMVVAVGPGKYENGTWIEMTVKSGDVVMFDLAGSVQMESDYVVMREPNIIAVIG